MPAVPVQNITRALRAPLALRRCDTFGARLRGMMFQRSVDRAGGLLFVQARASRVDAAIHMFFVPFALGVVWLDESRTVVDVCTALPWRPFYQPSQPARYILEIHPDRLAEFQVGDQLTFPDA